MSLGSSDIVREQAGSDGSAFIFWNLFSSLFSTRNRQPYPKFS